MHMCNSHQISFNEAIDDTCLHGTRGDNGCHNEPSQSSDVYSLGILRYSITALQ